jgi:hypothetical protein
MNTEPIEIEAEVVGVPKQLPPQQITGTLLISLQQRRIKDLEKQIDNLVKSTREKISKKQDEIDLCLHRIKKYSEADQPPPPRKHKPKI